jgi:dTDP-4-amino-4,6-dideoxygalactose transaminase
VTHLYGQTLQLELLANFLRQKNIFLIEDCAQAIGAYVGEGRAGSIGDISTFSFYPTKNLGAIGDAGAICTSNEEIFNRLKSLREYGWSRRYFSEIPFGGNNRIDEIQALVLDTQLSMVDEWNLRRRQIWERYKSAADKSGLRILGSASRSFVAHLAVIDSENRARLTGHLNAHMIETAIHYPYPDYVQPGLTQDVFNKNMPTTERLCASVMSIPLFPELTESEISRVENALASYRI